MPKVGIEPTFIGRNKDFQFVVPKKLFKLKPPEEDIERATARKFSKYLRGTFKGFQNARETKYHNKSNTKTRTEDGFWKEFEKEAHSLGIDLIGYTAVREEFVFYDLKVYGKNAIILGMEMKWEEIKKAPSVFCEIECFRVYYKLGEITIQLTEFLKGKGYKSEAHHPFGGKLLYPPHAVSAHLGIMGRNGLVITPEFGPRQRWSIITTDAEIPEPPVKDFNEMKKFCKQCESCIRNCKGGAAHENPIKKDWGQITHINRSKCIQSILDNNYCSVCLKICPQGK
ncbi:MAG: reductive dehalogenase domain-containing protein [Promethearchaeia archaeon]